MSGWPEIAEAVLPWMILPVLFVTAAISQIHVKTPGSRKGTIGVGAFAGLISLRRFGRDIPSSFVVMASKRENVIHLPDYSAVDRYY
jgi:hypothetical protein